MNYCNLGITARHAVNIENIVKRFTMSFHKKHPEGLPLRFARDMKRKINAYVEKHGLTEKSDSICEAYGDDAVNSYRQLIA